MNINTQESEASMIWSLVQKLVCHLEFIFILFYFLEISAIAEGCILWNRFSKISLVRYQKMCFTHPQNWNKVMKQTTILDHWVTDEWKGKFIYSALKCQIIVIFTCFSFFSRRTKSDCLSLILIYLIVSHFYNAFDWYNYSHCIYINDLHKLFCLMISNKGCQVQMSQNAWLDEIRISWGLQGLNDFHQCL